MRKGPVRGDIEAVAPRNIKAGVPAERQSPGFLRVAGRWLCARKPFRVLVALAPKIGHSLPAEERNIPLRTRRYRTTGKVAVRQIGRAHV